MYISEGKNAHEEFSPFLPLLVPSSIGKLLQRPRSDIPGGLHLVSGQRRFQRWPSIPQKTTVRSGRTSGLAKENKRRLENFISICRRHFFQMLLWKKRCWQCQNFPFYWKFEICICYWNFYSEHAGNYKMTELISDYLA